MTEITPATFRSSFESAFTTFWASATPIEFQNDDFSPADEFAQSGGSVTAAQSDAEAWVAASIQPEDQQDVGLSVNPGGTYRVNAALQFDLYVRQGTGRARRDALENELKRFLERIHLVTGAWRTGPIVPTEIGPDGVWYQITVSAPVSYFTARAT